jgi:transposase
VQVIDRFHIVRNLRDALERFFLRHRQGLKTLDLSCPQGPTYGSSEPSPSLAMVSQPRHERWVDLYHQIQRLHAQQLGIATIAQRVQVSRPTVYRYLAMPQPHERQRSRHRMLATSSGAAA